MSLIKLWKHNLFLRVFGITKVPMILYTGAMVTEFSDQKIVIRIPFYKRNRNHLNSMYFGTLCVGADVAGGLLGMAALRKISRGKGNLIFKDFKASFLKRAEGATYFTCQSGAAILEAVKKAEESLERVEIPVHVTATVPDCFGDEPVAEFTLTLSMKVKVS